MKTTVSTKYQIVIPKTVRRKLGILPGQKMQVQAAKDGSLVVRKEVITDYHDLLGAAKAQNIDAVKRVRKIRDNWR